MHAHLNVTISRCTVTWTLNTYVVSRDHLSSNFALKRCYKQTAVPSRSCSQAVWHISLLCVQWKALDDGRRNCPKYVEFYSKNKFEKLVHLVGFIIRSFKNISSVLKPRYNVHVVMTSWFRHWYNKIIKAASDVKILLKRHFQSLTSPRITLKILTCISRPKLNVAGYLLYIYVAR